MNGHIRLHRSLIEWEWYDDHKVKILFLHLLLRANWRDKNWRGKTIKRGQLVTSIQHLSEETGLSYQSVRTCISKLKSTGELTSEATNGYTLLTIVNYVVYQDAEDLATHKTTREATNEQQTNNKRTTTTEEREERKNKEKESTKEKESSAKMPVAENVKLTNEELTKLNSQFGEEFTNACIVKLDNYKGANGKRYKSDYRAILNWVVSEVSKTHQVATKQLTEEDHAKRRAANMF